MDPSKYFSFDSILQEEETVNVTTLVDGHNLGWFLKIQVMIYHVDLILHYLYGWRKS